MSTTGRSRSWFLVALTVSCSLISCSPYEETVIVTVNRSGATVSNVRWDYRGGSHSVERLESESTYEWQARPSTESGLSMSFLDGLGTRHEVDVDVYLTPTLGSTVRLVVLSDGRVETTP